MAISFVAIGFLGWMSMSVLGLGIVRMVSAVTGSYGIAGATSATSLSPVQWPLRLSGG